MGVGRRLLIAFLSLYQFKKKIIIVNIMILIYIYIHIKLFLNIYIRTVGEVQMHSKYSKNARASWLPCPVHPVHPPPLHKLLHHDTHRSMHVTGRGRQCWTTCPFVKMLCDAISPTKSYKYGASCFVYS